MKSRKRKKIRLLVILTILVIVGIGTANLANNYYNNNSLVGHWVSEETGKTVTFTEDGRVEVDKIKTGDYIISSVGSMVYIIEDHTFDMSYQVDGRNLIWGIDEEEKFKRKGF